MRISDWSSDVCSSDLSEEGGPDRDEDRLTRQIDDQAGGEAGQQHGGGCIALGVNKESRPDSGIDRQCKGCEPEQEPDKVEGSHAAEDERQSHRRTPVGRARNLHYSAFCSSIIARSEDHTSELQSLMRKSD